MIGKFTEWVFDSNILDEASKTNTAIPESEDSKYNETVIGILREIEHDFEGLKLTYPSNPWSTGLRFTVNAGTTFNSINVSSANDRKPLYNNMIKYIYDTYKGIELWNDDIDTPESGVIYIRANGRSKFTMASKFNAKKQKLPDNFSSAGGIEFYCVDDNQTYILDFEIAGSARSDSAVNTKLREITPCIMFEMYCKNNHGKPFTKLNQFFNDPKKSFETIKNDILNLKKVSPELGCDLQTLRNSYNFEDNQTNKVRISAFIVGVKTLEVILKKYNNPLKHQTVVNVRYTGLDTMAGGGSGSTEDILVVTQYDEELDETTDIKISLKSGNHKIREPGFDTLLNSFNIPGAKIELMPPTEKNKKQPIIKGNTLYIAGTTNKKGDAVYENKPEDIVKKYFELLFNLNNGGNKQQENIAAACKNWLYPDENMEVWNITEKSFIDMKSEFEQLKHYKYVRFVPKTGTKCINLEFYNKSNKKDVYNLFRLRWYKRDGANTPGQYKIIFENDTGKK